MLYIRERNLLKTFVLHLESIDDKYLNRDILIDSLLLTILIINILNKPIMLLSNLSINYSFDNPNNKMISLTLMCSRRRSFEN